ncbi:TIGR04255 family protein [Sphingomonas hengshuiensis]|uniref:TIGR04255 family protein n=1 Tax=Sphingomonas hengshuiensis TaxID=1609977 RepID=UPI00138DE011|nr:TIGR04255 family protein [Sphingomonas hengshuiensis]
MTTYSSPPIIEAVIEVRFGEPAKDTRLLKASDWLKPRYSNVSIEEQIEANVDFPTRHAEFVSGGRRYRHSSDDLADAVVLSHTGVAWTRLAPYEGWDQFLSRASQELKSVLKALASPRLTRIGLRFINRIDVPSDIDGLAHYEEYINYRIEAGPLMEPSMGYQWLIRSHHSNHNLIAILQSATVPPEIPGTSAFTLDIDIASVENVPQSSDTVSEKLGHMRELKNDIFEAGITEKARELYR